MMEKPAPRGRPRAFDQERVLDRVMRVFWAHGFEATTYRELERATGQRRQSLVYAFGDKRAMFLAALRHYAETRVEDLCTALAAGKTAKAGVLRAFELWLKDARRRQRRGCFMVTIAGEIGAKDPDSAKEIEAARKKLVTAFAAAFRRAAQEGHLRAGMDPDAIAHLAVAAGDGALLHARNAGASTAASIAFDGFLKSVFV